MKKIINNKLYDTETATEIGYWSNGYSKADFKFCNETLYKKKTGEFFLYGEGGALTEYSENHGNSQSEGNSIIPFTEEEAKSWSMKYLNADEYIEIFGQVEE